METYIIHESNQYEKFAFDPTNRPVDIQKVDKLVRLIQERNLLSYYPLLVNTNGIIVDGQHRFCAAKRLGLSFYYIIVGAINVTDIAEASTVQSGWKIGDQMHHYCACGYPEYIAIREFMRKYPWMTTSTAVGLCHAGDHKLLNAAFKNGTYKANALVFAEKVASAAMDFAPYIAYYREMVFVSTVRNLFQNREYQHERMVRKLKYLSSKMRKCTDVPSYMLVLSEIYNYKEPAENRVVLAKIMPGHKNFISGKDE